jgi:photosystem II stability/assembly factor-like uncharacterized protein
MRIRFMLSGVVFLLSASALSDQIRAQTWVDVGPRPGREIHSLMLDPTDPNRRMVATTAGLFIQEGPESPWRHTSGGFIHPINRGRLAEVRDLAEDPTRPGVIYAAVGENVYKSTDRGVGWRSLRDDEDYVVGDLVRVSPADPDVVYAMRTDSGWLQRSDDAGESWESFFEFAGAIDLIAGLVLDPDDPLTFLTAGRPPGLSGDGVILRSTDGGDSWETIATAPLDGVLPSYLGAGLSVHDLYLGTKDGSLYRSREADGLSWNPIGAGLPTDSDVHVLQVSVDPRMPERLLAVVDFPYSPYFDRNRETGSGVVWRSEDDGASWSRSDAGLPPEHHVRELVVSSHDGDVIYAPGSHGLFWSTDGGSTWGRVAPGLPSPAVDLLVRSGDGRGAADHLYVLGGLPELARTEDGGQSWRSLVGEGTDLPANADLWEIVSGPGASPSLYLLARDWPNIRFFRSDDGGDRWTELGEGLSELTLHELVVLPTSPSVLLAGGQAGLYRSDDEGETWTRTAVDTRIRELAVSPSDPSRVYGSVWLPHEYEEDAKWGIWASDDAGVTWSFSRQGLPRITRTGPLVADPADPATALVSIPIYRDGEGWMAALHRSVDGGATWSPWGSELPERGFTELLFHPTRASTLFAGTPEGVYRSLDAGRTWRTLGRGLPDSTVIDLGLSEDGSAVYATTSVGVHRLTLERDEGGEPEPPPPGPWTTDPSLDGFRLKVRIGGGGGGGGGATPVVDGTKEPNCIPETVCMSGALAGRSELFVRIVGPRPNGFLWPTLVRFTPSRVEVWIEQLATGDVRHYVLPASGPGDDTLPGLQDRTGFQP